MRYIYAGWRCIEEYKNNALQLTRVYGNNIDELLAVKIGSDEYYFHTNVQGNVVAISDDAGTVCEEFTYDIYGRLTYAGIWNSGTEQFDAVTSVDGLVDMSAYYTASLIDNEMFFQGRRWDNESDLYYFRNRQYDPQHGSFRDQPLKPDCQSHETRDTRRGAWRNRGWLLPVIKKIPPNSLISCIIPP